MDDAGPEKLRNRSVPRASITAECNAIVCWLRLNPSIAKTYGISELGGKTSVGSMFMQTLQAQGAAVEWYTNEPDGAGGTGKRPNCAWAAYIKRIYTRPGGRKKRLEERPEVAPPDNAAVLRHHGRLRRTSFPMLLRLSKYRRPKKTTACGNKVHRCRTPPSSPPSLSRPRARTGRRAHASGASRARPHHEVHRAAPALRLWQTPALLKGGLAPGAFPPCCAGSALPPPSPRTPHGQVGACASWKFVCEKSCSLPPLLTSSLLHGDDYSLNSKLHYGLVTCAISYTRAVSLLTLLGMNAPSLTDHYGFKAELEPVLANMAEHSMAEAHSEHVARGDTDYASLDGGFTAPRGAHGCTMPAHVRIDMIDIDIDRHRYRYRYRSI